MTVNVFDSPSRCGLSIPFGEHSTDFAVKHGLPAGEMAATPVLAGAAGQCPQAPPFKPRRGPAPSFDRRHQTEEGRMALSLLEAPRETPPNLQICMTYYVAIEYSL